MAKRCTGCLEWKDTSNFYRDRTKLDGLKSQCKDCRRTYKQGYRERKRATTWARANRTYKRIWQPRQPSQHEIVANSEGFKRWQKQRRAKRQARIKHYMRRWNKANRESGQYYAIQNKDLNMSHTHKYRTKKAGIHINSLSPDEWKWLKTVYDHCCAYCGQPSDALTADHVTPIAQGGHNTLSNIVPACASCNQHKGARTPTESGMKFAVQIDVLNHLQQQAFL